MNKRIILLCGLMSCCFYLLAQNRISDAGARLSFLMKYNINSSSFLSGRLRLLQTENFTQSRRITMDVGYWYKMGNGFRLSFHYMYRLHRMRDGFFKPLHRYYIRLDYRYPINKFFDVRNRLMLQHTTHRFVTVIDDNGFEPYYKTDLRERLGIVYNLSSKKNVYFQDEVLFSVNNEFLFWRNRIYIGYSNELSKKWRIKLYLLFQSNFNNINGPQVNYYLIGCDWVFNWN
ncbi:MAG: hypothetical protein KatS3mg027_1225 [Bacteroidia bacterium]|nr:MAG: hypothetical protein KatS3mg027_1225 [Bacteroidia bacterium]